MDSLFNSKKSAGNNQQHVKLENLSPEKYGRAAYAELTYTPSKLADNLLYREVTTLKKMEEGNGKLRETQAINSLFHDRLAQLKQERDGIQDSLSSQIKMYKKLLQQCEMKSEARIKEIQAGFKEEIRILILEKQQEAKYSQSEKELLENRIEELEGLVNSLRDQLNHSGNDFFDLKNAKEKLDIQHENICNKLAETQQRMKNDGEDARRQYQELSRKLYNSEVNFKGQLDEAMNKKDKEMQNLQRLHRTELQKNENKRLTENMMKNQQMKDIASTFQNEAKRMNEIINMKDRANDTLSKDLAAEKQRVLDLVRTYENEITDLSHDKNRLLQQVDQLSYQNSQIIMQSKQQQELSDKEKFELKDYIESLKSQLNLNQVNYVREKDNNGYYVNDLQREISALRAENTALMGMSSENQILTRQVRNLRELLLESSSEMEKCKQQFISMGRERELIYKQMKELGCENDVLYRIKHEIEQQAEGWKQSYYFQKRY